MLEEGVFSLLTNYAPLTALVSGRVTPVVLGKASLFPAVTFFLVSEDASPTLDNKVLGWHSIQIDTWGKNYFTPKQVMKVIHDLLDGYKGVLSDGTEVKDTQSDDNPDFFESDTLIYRCSTTFKFLI